MGCFTLLIVTQHKTGFKLIKKKCNLKFIHTILILFEEKCYCNYLFKCKIKLFIQYFLFIIVYSHIDRAKFIQVSNLQQKKHSLCPRRPTYLCQGQSEPWLKRKTSKTGVSNPVTGKITKMQHLHSSLDIRGLKAQEKRSRLSS